MSILQRPTSVLDDDARRDATVFGASALIATIAGAVALATGIVGILILGY